MLIPGLKLRNGFYQIIIFSKYILYHTIIILQNNRVLQSTKAADRMTKAHKRVADTFIGVASYLALLPMTKDDPLSGLVDNTH